jgi:hypothetical protein
VGNAKHRWRRHEDQTNALINRVERQRKQQEMMEEHKNIKKSGLRQTSAVVEETSVIEETVESNESE